MRRISAFLNLLVLTTVTHALFASETKEMLLSTIEVESQVVVQNNGIFQYEYTVKGVEAVSDHYVGIVFQGICANDSQNGERMSDAKEGEPRADSQSGRYFVSYYAPNDDKEWQLEPQERGNNYTLVLHSRLAPKDIEYSIFLGRDSQSRKQTLQGVTRGPACKKREPGVFNGEKMPNEENRLLRYSAPLTNISKVIEGKIRIGIYYSENMDISTFKVIPEKYRKYFNPKQGAFELVEFQLNKNTSLEKIVLGASEIHRSKTFDIDQFIFIGGYN